MHKRYEKGIMEEKWSWDLDFESRVHSLQKVLWAETAVDDFPCGEKSYLRKG